MCRAMLSRYRSRNSPQLNNTLVADGTGKLVVVRYLCSSGATESVAGGHRNSAPSYFCTLPETDPLQNELAQSGAGAGSIVRNRVGPRFDPAGECPRNAGLLHRGVKAGEFGIAPVEF